MFARILISNCVPSPSALSARIRPNGLSNYLVSTLKAKPKPNVINSLKYGFVFGGTASLVYLKLTLINKATCEAQTRISPLETSTTNVKKEQFDWSKFCSMLLPHSFYILIAISSALVVAFLNIQLPQLLGSVVNVVANNLNQNHDASPNFSELIKEPAVKMIKLYLAQSAFTFSYIYSLSCVGERIAAKLREDLFASLLSQDMEFFDRHKSGELASRLSSDVQEFKSSFKLCVSQGLRCSTQTVGCCVSLYLVSPQLTGVMCLIVPTVILAGSLIGSMLRKLSRRAQAQMAQAHGVGEECLGNIRTVRAFAMEGTEADLYSGQVEKARELNEKLGLGIGLFQGGTNLFLNSLVLGTLYLGGHLLSAGQLTAGDLMSFLVATQTIQRSLGQLSLLFGNYVKGMSAGCRIFEFINLDPKIPLTGGAKIPYMSFKGDIEFTDVCFRYPTRPDAPVLDHFNLRIPPGRTVALVGASGEGKSTLAALLERFYDVESGSISIDGKDIRGLDPSWLRGQMIGYINQEPVLFATTIRENIRYGRPAATDQEVEEAAASANAHTFINSFPDGYDTWVGERGVTMSGGQKQRIAIARALVKNPRILVLDEATSALDTESEKIVQDALDQVSKNRSVLVIAHRMSTIQGADVIAVIKDGKIAEIGMHQDLKLKKGLYFDLINRQEQKPQQAPVG